MTGLRVFGQTSAGQTIHAIDLAAGQLRATILTYGATLNDLRLAGTPWPLVLGGLDVGAYEGPMVYSGAIVGPVANRIEGARATLDGQALKFDANEGGRTTLHGGATGLHAKLWSVAAQTDNRVTLFLDLPDGEGGFPGNRRIEARFAILAPATLSIELSGCSDKVTLMNLANHSYWNLDGTPDTSGQTLTVAADRYLPVDDHLIPVGPPVSVSGTVFDFRRGRRLDTVARYDHNLCLSDGQQPLRPVATLEGLKGVRMTLGTTEPGLQVYDGRGIATAPYPGLTGVPYGAFSGIALEAQGWPNAPNRPDFPPVSLAPGESYRQTTTFAFSRAESG